MKTKEKIKDRMEIRDGKRPVHELKLQINALFEMVKKLKADTANITEELLVCDLEENYIGHPEYHIFSRFKDKIQQGRLTQAVCQYVQATEEPVALDDVYCKLVNYLPKNEPTAKIRAKISLVLSRLSGEGKIQNHKVEGRKLNYYSKVNFENNHGKVACK